MISKPYLIQRIIEEKDLGQDKNKLTFDQMFKCDYMGSAEFEYGALPNSLKKFCSAKELFTKRFSEVKDLDDNHLRIIGLNESDVNEYFTKYMEDILSDSLRLKECTRIKTYLTKKDFRGREITPEVTIWWDIKNHIFFTFAKNRMRKIQMAIRDTADMKKESGKSGWYYDEKKTQKY